MFNVAVFRLKDMLRYLVVISISIIMVIMATRFFRNKKQIQVNVNIGNQIEKAMEGTYTQTIDTQIPLISKIEENEKATKDSTNKYNYSTSFLETQISAINVTKENKEQETQEIEIAEQVPDNQEEVKTGVETQVVTNNPITESFNTQYKNVKIKNQTSINLTEEILTPNITIDNKKVIIYHTHSCESYTSSEKYPYTPTGTFRTTDLKYTVTGVGTELENQLKRYNIPVVHDMTYHDYPAYNGSYTRSLATVENILKTDPADIIIDLHRDAIGSRSDYAPTVKIGEDYCAQMMFVMGTNEGGLQHPNWQQNLKFAVKVQEKAEELYPGLFKPIMVSENRYNQHAGKYANIIEVGATGNTLEQCLASMKYLAKVISEVEK